MSSNLNGELQGPGLVYGKYKIPLEMDTQKTLSFRIEELENQTPTQVSVQIDGYQHQVTKRGDTSEDGSRYADTYRSLVGIRAKGEWRGTRWHWFAHERGLSDAQQKVLSKDIKNIMATEHPILPPRPVRVGDSWELSTTQAERLMSQPDALSTRHDIRAKYTRVTVNGKQKRAVIRLQGEFHSKIRGAKHGKYTIEGKIKDAIVLLSTADERVTKVRVTMNTFSDYPNASYEHSIQGEWQFSAKYDWMKIEE